MRRDPAQRSDVALAGRGAPREQGRGLANGIVDATAVGGRFEPQAPAFPTNSRGPTGYA